METENPPGKSYVFRPLVLAKQQVSAEPWAKPVARSGHRIVCDKDNVYSYGGFNPAVTFSDPGIRNDKFWPHTRPLFREIWKFNVSNKTWTRLPHQETVPCDVSSAVLVLRGETLLVHGGTGVPFGENCNNNVYVCNVNDGRMQVVAATGELPEPLYGQAAVFQEPYLYVVDGTNGLDYNSHVHRFDLRTSVWELMDSNDDPYKPKGRYRHELAFDGRIIYVLGGGTASEAFGFAELSAFDTLTRKWMILCTQSDAEKNYPAPRSCHGLVQYTDEKTGSTLVIISGGYNGSQGFNDIWRLDLGLLQWTCLKTCILSKPTYFHSAAVTLAGQMFTFGGITVNNNEIARTDEIHSVWLTIPKLSDICWEALNFYFPSLKKVDLLKKINIS